MKELIVLFKIKRVRKILLSLLSVSLVFNFYFLWRLYGERIFGDVRDIGEVRGRAVRVIDGDTFDLEKGIRIRLTGAEAPEYPKGCLSLQAKERLGKLILGKEVKIEMVEKDSFGRLVAFVEVEGLLVDKVLIEEGLAQAKNGNHPKYGASLLAAQDSAKKAKRGIWSPACASECLIKGNIREDKGTKIYHLPGCFNYERIVINEREGDKWFCFEDEAVKSGFRKSEDCPEL